MYLGIILLLLLTLYQISYSENLGVYLQRVIHNNKTEDVRENHDIPARNESELLDVHQRLSRMREKWKKDLTENETTWKQDEVSSYMNVLRRTPMQKMKRKNINQINSDGNMTEYLYQADIVLTSDQAERMEQNMYNTDNKRGKRQAMRDSYYPYDLWMDKNIFYYYDTSVPQEVKDVFEKAVALWTQYACINFYRSRTAPDRVKVVRQDGCWSYIGRIGGEQLLSLGLGCEEVHIAAHEIGHALGFFHSQSRYDRDTAIKLITRNIEPQYLDQFNKETILTNDNYGIPYDYGSIMQYAAYSGSIGYGPSMLARDSKYQDTMGSGFIAFYDIKMMNIHYQCNALCQKKPKCENYGIVDSRDCSRCLCPTGFGGDLCDQRPSDCGKTVNATANYKTLEFQLNDEQQCTYWIQAPVGRGIEIQLVSYDGPYDMAGGCTLAGLEIKTFWDKRRTGYRICYGADEGTKYISTKTLVPVIIYSIGESVTAKIKYKHVKKWVPPKKKSKKSKKSA